MINNIFAMHICGLFYTGTLFCKNGTNLVQKKSKTGEFPFLCGFARLLKVRSRSPGVKKRSRDASFFEIYNKHMFLRPEILYSRYIVMVVYQRGKYDY